jgi:hypothetical protein
MKRDTYPDLLNKKKLSITIQSTYKEVMEATYWVWSISACSRLMGNPKAATPSEEAELPF